MTQAVLELTVQKLIPEVSYRKIPPEHLELVKSYDSVNCGCVGKRTQFSMLHAQLAPMVRGWELTQVQPDYKIYKMSIGE